MAKFEEINKNWTIHDKKMEDQDEELKNHQMGCNHDQTKFLDEVNMIGEHRLEIGIKISGIKHLLLQLN